MHVYIPLLTQYWHARPQFFLSGLTKPLLSTEQLSPFPYIYFWSHMVKAYLLSRISPCPRGGHPTRENGSASIGLAVRQTYQVLSFCQANAAPLPPWIYRGWRLLPLSPGNGISGITPTIDPALRVNRSYLLYKQTNLESIANANLHENSFPFDRKP